jgi:hypothetical protein
LFDPNLRKAGITRLLKNSSVSFSKANPVPRDGRVTTSNRFADSEGRYAAAIVYGNPR